MEYQHSPVMLKEVLEFLNPQTGQYFIDCTLGGGGYTVPIAKLIRTSGRIISIDLDIQATQHVKTLIKKNKYKNIILVHDNFKNLSKIVKKYINNVQIPGFTGIVFDLGLSKAQLADRNRGFSFLVDAPLKMTFGQTADPSAGSLQRGGQAGQQTAENIVNNWNREELEKIIREYGEERYAQRIARAIVETRKNTPVKTTKQLVEIIKKAVPKKYLYNRIHPATRTFQALRIATNNELENLKQALPQAVDLVASDGKIVVISYHSLEDRIVKQFFKKESRDCLCPPSYPACRCQHKARLKILTSKIIRPTKEEIYHNPSARSAKLRVAEKI